MVSNVSLIQSIGKEVAKIEKNKREIDTENEQSIFIKKLEKNNIENASEIVNNYLAGKEYYENLFAVNGSKATDSDEYAIYAALNKKSYLNVKEEDTDVSKIVKMIKHDSTLAYLNRERDFTRWFYTNDNTKAAIKQLNSKNIMAFLKDNMNLVDDVIDDALSDDELAHYGKVMLDALVKAANERGIDLSPYIKDSTTLDKDAETKAPQGENESTTETPKTGVYTVVNIPGLNPGDVATDKKNFSKVIMFLYEVIEKEGQNNAKELDNDSSSEDYVNKIHYFANVVDNGSKGDKNGKVNGEEVSFFKQLCKSVGIYVNKILTDINDKTESDDTLNEVENAIKSVFDEDGISTEKSTSAASRLMIDSIVEGAYKELENDGTFEGIEHIEKYLRYINKDNVLDVLKTFKAKHSVSLANHIEQNIHTRSNEKDLERYVFAALWALVESKDDEELTNKVSQIIYKEGDDFIIADSEYGDVGDSVLASRNVKGDDYDNIIDAIVKLIEEYDAE